MHTAAAQRANSINISGQDDITQTTTSISYNHTHTMERAVNTASLLGFML
jgi:hypothetical protein